MNYFRLRTAVLFVALMLLGALPTQALAVQTPGAGTSNSALTPEGIRDYGNLTVDSLTSYTIEVRIDEAMNQIDGSETVRFVNDTGAMLDEVAFRLFPNAEYYGDGDIEIDQVEVNRLPTAPEYVSKGTAMTVPLASSLREGDSTEIALDFTVTIPENSQGSYGIFSDDTERGTLVLSDWYPSVAGWEEGSGWSLVLPTSAGDPTFADAAFFDVTFDVPETMTVVATGIESVTEGEIGRVFRQFETGPVRDFAAVADDDFVATSRTVGQTTVNFYASRDSVNDAVVDQLIDEAVGVLESHGQIAGAYPYTEIDLVSTNLAGAIGVAWSGVVFLDAVTLEASGGLNPLLQYLIAHEILHQWWGVIVGANSNEHGFMNESMASYLAIVVLEDLYGSASAFVALQMFIIAPYLKMLSTTGDGIVDVPYTDDMDSSRYASLVYGKGAIGLMAIHQAIGDDAFFLALRDYVDEFAFEIAEPADLLATFETASGQDLDALWTFWFESAFATPDDVARVVS